MKGNIYIVTGAASGIGLATVQNLLSQGATVIAADIDEATSRRNLSPLQDEHGDRLSVHALDVTKREQVASLISSTKRQFNRLDGYTNVAGTGGHKLGLEPITATTDAEYDFIMDLNTRATYYALAEVLRPDTLIEPGGSIVCVGSMFGQRGFKNGAVFAASKHAMAGLVKSAALEAGSRGIRVNIVEPGATDTPMNRMYRAADMPDPTPNNPIPRLGTAEEAAAAIVFLLSDASSYVTGACLAVDGGANS